MSEEQSIEKLKAEAMRLGFSACGVSRCEPVEQKVADAFVRWVEAIVPWLIWPVGPNIDLLPEGKSLKWGNYLEN